MRTAPILVLVLGAAAMLRAQDPLEGVWQGYDGEWLHVSRQLTALAGSIPAEKFSWRPGAGVRSVSEVVMHVAIANFALLNVTGVPPPEGLKAELEKSITSKAEVIGWLNRSLDAVKTAHLHVKASDLSRKVEDRNYRGANVEGMYLRILVHANEHMGQLVAYARVNGIVPPWSSPAGH